MTNKPLIQPPSAWPRFLFRFHFRIGRTPKRVYAAAYTTKLANKQANALARLWDGELIAVKKLQRMSWKDYSNSNIWWRYK